MGFRSIRVGFCDGDNRCNAWRSHRAYRTRMVVRFVPPGYSGDPGSVSHHRGGRRVAFHGEPLVRALCAQVNAGSIDLNDKVAIGLFKHQWLTDSD